MKYQQFLFLLMIALITGGCDSNQIKIGQNDFVIQNVNIVDIKTGELWQNMTLIVRGSKIDTIAKTDHIRLTGSGTLVDGSRKYLIPGLWDMHVHLINEPYTREVFYPLFIANGITGIRVMAADCFEPCDEPNMKITQHRNLQNEIKQGKLLGPKSILASYYINGGLNGESTILKPRTEEHGRELARLLKDRKVDFIKIYDELNPEAYYGITDEAKKLNLEFAGHVPLAKKVIEVSKAGQRSIEHAIDNLFLDCSDIEDNMRARLLEMFGNEKGDFNYVNVEGINKLSLEMVENFDSLKCEEIYQILIDNNTWIVPTLRLLEVYYPDTADWKDHPNIKYMPKDEYDVFAYDYGPAMRKFWGPFNPKIEKKRRQLVSNMNDTGVGLLAGSDVGEVGLIGGFSLHEELLSLQNAGLTPLEALQTATLNPAKYQNAIDSIGTIEIGKIADLILLNKNPLEDIANTQTIEAVFTNGRYLNRKDLDSLLSDVENYIKNEK